MTTTVLLSGRLGLLFALAAAFGAALILLLLLLPRRGQERERQLDAALRPYSRRPAVYRTARGALSWLGALLGSARRQQKRDRNPKPHTGYRLELAGWPMRPSEFKLLRVAIVVTSFLLALGLTSSPMFATALAVLGWITPSLWLTRTIDRRSESFLAQLPDTLVLLASSLEAGHSLLQGMEAVVEESPSPTSTEFARVLAEIRLGMPVAEALESMAGRIGGDEFKWAVFAMNIQRDVGGNLAVLLRTVSDTLRQREQLRRQVKVLSAEGRMSGGILTALPFLLALYLAAVNPTYLQVLLTNGVGRLMLLTALGLLIAGSLWMRKLVRIEV